MNTIDLLSRELVEVNSNLKELELKASVLKESILEELIKQGKDTHDGAFGKATIARRRSYEFSSGVLKAEENIKIVKQDEIERGVAKESVTEYLTFKPKINNK